MYVFSLQVTAGLASTYINSPAAPRGGGSPGEQEVDEEFPPPPPELLQQQYLYGAAPQQVRRVYLRARVFNSNNRKSTKAK